MTVQFPLSCFLQTIIFRSMILLLKCFCLNKEHGKVKHVLCTLCHTLSDPSPCLSTCWRAEHLVVCLLTETASSMSWTYDKYSILSFYSFIPESHLNCSFIAWGVIALSPLGFLYCQERQRLEEGLSYLGWKGFSLFSLCTSVWPGQERGCWHLCASSAASAFIPEGK